MWIFSLTQMLFNVETYNQTKQPNKRLNKHLPYITFLARLVSAVVLEINTSRETDGLESRIQKTVSI